MAITNKKLPKQKNAWSDSTRVDWYEKRGSLLYLVTGYGDFLTVINIKTRTLDEYNTSTAKSLKRLKKSGIPAPSEIKEVFTSEEKKTVDKWLESKNSGHLKVKTAFAKFEPAVGKQINVVEFLFTAKGLSEYWMTNGETVTSKFNVHLVTADGRTVTAGTKEFQVIASGISKNLIRVGNRIYFGENELSWIKIK